ncbi:MAG: ABC transporter permease [Acidimicrobiia bacterium]|nr:ABC transporter permease [Acidimicrobiia bacterium]
MFLAIREIARAKTRFLLLAGAVGLLVFLITFQQGLFGGLVTSFIGAVRNQNAPMLVFNDQARQNVEGSFLFPEQESAIAAVDGVAASGPIGQNTFTVLVQPDDEVVDEDAVVFGYELGGLGEPTTLSEGRLPTGPNEAVASAINADEGFDIGDEVQVVGVDGPVITIVGLGEDLQWSVSPSLFVSFDTFAAAQLAVNPAAGQVLPSLVAVEPEPDVSLDELSARIEAAVPGTEALTREEAVANNPGVQGTSQSFQIIFALAFVVVTLVVGFFFLILTTQKAKPLTLLRAVGAPSGYLVRNLVAQILLVMGAGIVIGAGLTVLVDSLVSDTIPIDLELRTIVITVVALLVLALLGGLVSVRRVLQIDPIRATTDSGRML